jgi:transposase
MDYEVTNQVTDHGMMAPTTEGLQQENEGKILEAVADKGYDKAEDMIACLENGVIPHVVLPDGKDEYDLEMDYQEAENLHPESTDSVELKKCLHAGVIPEAYEGILKDIEIVEVRRMIRDENALKAESPYGSEEEMKVRAKEGYFVRDPERDLVYCPGGETLRKKSIKKNGVTRYANKHACFLCPYRGQCVTDRGITKWKEVDFSKDKLERPARWYPRDDKDDSDKNDPPKPPKRMFEKVKIVRFKLRPDRKKMNQRMCLSEHPFGTLKQAMGATFFLLKGKLKTNGEFALLSMGYNLARVENLFGFWGLMQKVRG